MNIDGVECRALPYRDWKDHPLLSQLVTKSSALSHDRCLVFLTRSRPERKELLRYVLQYRTDGDWTTWQASDTQAFYGRDGQMTSDAVSWYMYEGPSASVEYRMLVPVAAPAAESESG